MTHSRIIAITVAAIVLGSGSVGQAGLWDELKSSAESSIRNVTNDLIQDDRDTESSNAKSDREISTKTLSTTAQSKEIQVGSENQNNILRKLVMNSSQDSVDKNKPIASICPLPSAWKSYENHFHVTSTYGRDTYEQMENRCSAGVNPGAPEWLRKGVDELCQCIKSKGSSNTSESVHRRNIKTIVEHYAINDFDRFDIQDIKLGMRKKDVQKILANKGYSRTEPDYVRRTKTAFEKYKGIRFSPEPVTREETLTRISLEQSFTQDVRIDAEDLYNKIIDKYGKPDNVFGGVNKNGFRIEYHGDIESSFSLFGNRFTKKIGSVKFAQSLDDASNLYMSAKHDAAESKKPTASVEF